MSKLADRIRKASRPEPAPLGFAAAARRPPAPTLLCIVRLAENEAQKAADAAAKGADAVIIERADPRKLKDHAAKADNLAMGVRPAKPGRETISSLREAGADFAIIDPEEALAEALLEEKIGYVLALTREADDTTLRLLADMGLDAIAVSAPGQPLTVDRLLALRRISALTRTPLLAEVSADADASLLQVLRDSGAAGVIVGSSALGKLADLRKRIEALPARGRRREERAEAVLPAQGHLGYEEEEEDED